MGSYVIFIPYVTKAINRLYNVSVILTRGCKITHLIIHIPATFSRQQEPFSKDKAAKLKLPKEQFSSSLTLLVSDQKICRDRYEPGVRYEIWSLM